MKNNIYVRWLTVLGLFSVFILQSVWLHGTFKLIQDDIYKECCQILNKSLRQEMNLLSSHIPEGAEIVGGPQNDLISEYTYLYDGLYQLGIQYSIEEIDSIVGIYLKEKNIAENYIIYSINPKTEEVYKKSKPDAVIHKFGLIKSDIIPTRINLSLGIQLVLNNPYKHILERMRLLLISTVVMMAFIIGCIMYQIKIVSRLNQISKIREDFSYAMIHDMKTPLSTLSMTLDFLHSGRLDNKPAMKENYYKIAKSEVGHLLMLTNKVLTISKLESHKLEMDKEEVALEPMVEKLTEKFTTKSTKPVRFEVNLQAPEIYADEEYLEGVLSNLIDNAIKYSKASVEVKISSERTEQYTLLRVRDNGLGISEADQRIIFAKYERAAASKRNRMGGAAGFGLGLNFVEQVISAHGGKVLVNSIEGEFTEFTIYLPHQTATA